MHDYSAEKVALKGLISLVMPIGILFSACMAEQPEGSLVPDEKEQMKDTITITVTYDNNRYDSRLTTAWGFSCVIKSLKRLSYLIPEAMA